MLLKPSRLQHSFLCRILPRKRRDSTAWIQKGKCPSSRGHQVDDQLFVGFEGAKKGKAVQKQTISQWIVLCIKICYTLAKKQPPEGLRAHSPRAKATSTALPRGVPVLDICQAAAWVSLHTFTKHYCQVRRDWHFAHSVLQDVLV